MYFLKIIIFLLALAGAAAFPASSVNADDCLRGPRESSPASAVSWSRRSARLPGGGVNSREEEQEYRARLKARGQYDVRRWLFLLGALCPPALIFLLYRAINPGGGLFPEDWESVATKIAMLILALTLSVYAYFITAWFPALILGGASAVLIALSLILPFIREIRRKKFGVASFRGGWICRRCGRENGPIQLECPRCGSPSPK